MEPASQIGKHRSALVVRMSRHVQDPRGNPGAFDGLDGFRQADSCPRRGRKLCHDRSEQERRQPASHHGKERQTLKIEIHATSKSKASENSHCEPVTIDGEVPNGHCRTFRARMRNARAPSAISARPHFRVAPVCQNSQAHPTMVSTAGSGYSHILNGNRSVHQRRRSNITPTACPMNCTSNRRERIPAMAVSSCSETLKRNASPPRTSSDTCGKCFLGCRRANTGKKFPSSAAE